MNYSVCSILELSLRPFVEDIFADPKYITITAIVFSAVTLFTLLANLMFIITMLWTNRKRNYRRNRPNDNKIAMILMISMALSDLANSVSVMPLSIIEVIDNGKWNLGTVWCNARLAMNDFFCSVSILHVNCMALDRYMAVCKPLFFRTLTSKIGYIMVVISWLAPTFLVVLPHIVGWDNLEGTHAYKCSGENCSGAYIPPSLVNVVTVAIYLSFLMAYVLYFFILREVSNFHKRKTRYSNKPSVGPCREISKKLIRVQNHAKVYVVSANHALIVASGVKEEEQVGCSLDESKRHNVDDFADFGASETVNTTQSLKCNTLTVSLKCDTPTVSLKCDYPTVSLKCDTPTVSLKCDTPTVSLKCDTLTVSLKFDTPTVSPRHEIPTYGTNSKIRTITATEMTCNQNDITIDENKTASSVRESCVISNPAPTSSSIMASKAYGTVGCLVLCFTACWIPSWIFLPAYTQVFGVIRPWVVMVIIWLAYIHGAINPVLYLSNRSVRNRVKAFCGVANKKK